MDFNQLKEIANKLLEIVETKSKSCDVQLGG